MKTLEELLEYLEDDEDSSFCEFVPEASIAEAEYFLKVELPPSFKAFLLAAGTGEGRAGRFSGFGSEGYRDSKLAEDIEWMKERSSLVAQGKLLPFADDFSGNFYCFDYRRKSSDGECAVVFWDRPLKFGDEPQPVADNFLEFMLQSVEESE